MAQALEQMNERLGSIENDIVGLRQEGGNWHGS